MAKTIAPKTAKAPKASKKPAPPNLAAAKPDEGDKPAPLPPHRKQTEIPGTERPRVAAIDEKASEYVTLRDKRAAMQVKEKGLKAELGELLKQHDVSSYRYIDGGVEYVVELDTTEKLTVSKTDEED